MLFALEKFSANCHDGNSQHIAIVNTMNKCVVIIFIIVVSGVSMHGRGRGDASPEFDQKGRPCICPPMQISLNDSRVHTFGKIWIDTLLMTVGLFKVYMQFKIIHGII